MYLSEFIDYLDIKILNDGEFNVLGYVDTNIDNKVLTYITSEQYINNVIKNINITCVVCNEKIADKINKKKLGIIVSDSPKKTIFEIHNILSERKEYIGDIFTTTIGKNCIISDSVVISKDNVVIGNNVTIEENVIIRKNVTIKDNVIIRTGTIIGGKGFSFTKDENGNNFGVKDLGNIIIEKNVELFEYVLVTTGIFPWETTYIGEHTKVDSKCNIAHGTSIGCNCLLAAFSKCSGNCTVGDNTWLGVGATISNRVKVNDNARISLESVVVQNVKKNETVTGNFAINHDKFIANMVRKLR